MLTRPMPSFRQMRFSIWPRLEAAAVCTRALWPSRRMVSTMPSAVSGLTKQDAPSAALAPSGSTRHWSARMARYWAYIAPPSTATVLPSSACAAGDAPAATTVPAPSLPTGRDWPTRAAMLFIARSGTCAVTTGRAGVPETRAVAISAAPNSRPMSDGLMGVASMRTMTSSAAGSGVGTSCSEISSSPSALMSERSCSPVGAREWVMGSPRCLKFTLAQGLRRRARRRPRANAAMLDRIDPLSTRPSCSTS
jgi:hypothetical protein